MGRTYQLPQACEQSVDQSRRYYAPDAAFRHPLCDVPAGPKSRGQILGILQYAFLATRTTRRISDTVF